MKTNRPTSTKRETSLRTILRKTVRKLKEIKDSLSDDADALFFLALGRLLIGTWAFCSLIGAWNYSQFPACPLWLAWPIAVVFLFVVAGCAVDFLRSLAPPDTSQKHEKPTQETEEVQADDDCTSL